MKSGRAIFIMMSILGSCNGYAFGAGDTYSSGQSNALLYRDPAFSENESSIVQYIKTFSNITSDDVNRYKLLWTGPFGNLMPFVGGAYGLKKGWQYGKVGYNMASQVAPSKETFMNIFKNDLYLKILGERKPSERLINILSSQSTWAGVGMVGLGAAAYKVLNSRVQAGIFQKIKKLVEFCQTQVACIASYHTIDDLAVAFSQADNNTVWLVGDPFDRQSGFINLISQVNNAVLLIDQIKPYTPSEGQQGLAEMRRKLGVFKINLERNIALLSQDIMQAQAAQDYQLRRVGDELKRAQTQAEIGNINTEKWLNRWALVKDIGKTAYEYGPSIMATLGSIALVQKINNWFNPGKPVAASPESSAGGGIVQEITNILFSSPEQDAVQSAPDPTPYPNI